MVAEQKFYTDFILCFSFFKKKIFKFVHWNCQLPQSTGNCKPMICEKMNTVVLSVLKIMFSLRYLADCVSRFTELGFYFPKGKENQSPLSICFNTFFFFSDSEE